MDDIHAKVCQVHVTESLRPIPRRAYLRLFSLQLFVLGNQWLMTLSRLLSLVRPSAALRLMSILLLSGSSGFVA